MTQTTLIAGTGNFVFYFSSFQPVSQFGLLMTVLLAAALVGDLVLLPALLATRWGKGFQSQRLVRSSQQAVSPQPSDK
jgi:predicted RND superfamily exporter protein